MYSGGLNEGLAEQAKALYSSAQYSFSNIKTQTIANTYFAYYDVLQAEKNVALADDAVLRLSKHLSVVEAQYAEGIVIKSDLLRTEVELAQMKQNLSKAQNDCKMARSRFIMLLGLSDDQDIVLADLPTETVYDGLLSQAVAIALTHRMDLQQAYQEKEAAWSGVKIAQSGRLPAVSLSLKQAWQNQEQVSNLWSAQLMVSVNVFDGGSTTAKINQAEWETRNKQALLRQKQEQITMEIKEAYFNMQNAKTALAIASQVVNKAEEDCLIAQVRYQAGVGSNLDVIDAQGALTTAKLNHINSRYDYNKYGKVTKNTAGQTQTVSASTEEQSASMEEIASSSQNLARMAEQLKTTIRAFQA